MQEQSSSAASIFRASSRLAVCAHAHMCAPACLCSYLSAQSVYADKAGQWKGRSVWAVRPIPRTNIVPLPSLRLLNNCVFTDIMLL